MNNPILKCQQIIELLDAYHDEELLSSEKTDVENHLALCTSCQNQLANISNLVLSLKSIKPLAAPRDFASNIDFSKPALENNISSSGGAKIFHFPAKTWALASIAAAVALIMVISSPKSSTDLQVAVKKDILQEQPKPAQEELTATLPTESLQPVAKDHTAELVAVKQEPQQSLAPEPGKNNKTKSADSTQEYSTDREEIASVSDIGNISCTEALGIATDEDGLYDIKI